MRKNNIIYLLPVLLCFFYTGNVYSYIIPGSNNIKDTDNISSYSLRIPGGIVWEKEAECSIWDKIVESGSSGNDQVFAVNSHCSLAMIKKISAMREKAAGVLHSDTNSSNLKVYAGVYSRIYEYCGIAGVRPLSEPERKLVMNSMYGQCNFCTAKYGFTGNSGNNFLWLYVNKEKCIFSSSGFKKCVNNSVISINIHQKKIDPGKNYSHEQITTDYFRLFLYIWEDGPYDKAAVVRHGCALLRVALIPVSQKILESLRVEFYPAAEELKFAIPDNCICFLSHAVFFKLTSTFIFVKSIDNILTHSGVFFCGFTYRCNGTRSII